jgi:hypothetical protein
MVEGHVSLTVDGDIIMTMTTTMRARLRIPVVVMPLASPR